MIQLSSASATSPLIPHAAPTLGANLPAYAFAIDGSYAEVDVRNGYPGAKVGYVTVASILLDLKRIDELDENCPVDPKEFRKTEEASTLDAAMPGCNVVTRTHTCAVESFREAFYENFLDTVIDGRMATHYWIHISPAKAEDIRFYCLPLQRPGRV